MPGSLDVTYHKGNTKTVEAPLASQRPSETPLRAAISEAGRLVLPVVLVALLALVLTKALAPAIKTTGVVRGAVIDAIDLVAGISSHLFALSASALSIGLVLLLVRDKRVLLVTRLLLVVQTLVVLMLAVLASRERLAPVLSLVLGSFATTSALTGAIEGMRQPRSRVLGLVIMLSAFGAIPRLIASGLVAWPSSLSLVPAISRALASVSSIILGLALLTSMAWLASRKNKTMTLPTGFALLGSVGFAWLAYQTTNATSASWLVTIGRAADNLASMLPSSFPRPLEVFLAVLGPLGAIAALTTRRQIPSVVGALALACLAGIQLDIPSHAILILLAALATVLASQDEQGMWEALLGRRLAADAPLPTGINEETEKPS